jgi:hypothetical protein
MAVQVRHQQEPEREVLTALVRSKPWAFWMAKLEREKMQLEKQGMAKLDAPEIERLKLQARYQVVCEITECRGLGLSITRTREEENDESTE